MIVADYVAYHPEESSRRSALLFLPRIVLNPSLHANILLRLATRCPPFLMGFWRSLLIATHSIDLDRGLTIGPGLCLFHPHGLTFARGVTIGSNVTIMHNVTIGRSMRVRNRAGRAVLEFEDPGCPVIEDGVTILTGSVITGPITVGSGAVIAAGSFVDRDVPPGTVYRRGSSHEHNESSAGPAGRAAQTLLPSD